MKKQCLLLTQVLDGVVALLVVDLDGLGVRAADAVADGVAADHDVLVLGGRPAHHDAVDQRPDVQRAGLVRHAGFCRGATSGVGLRRAKTNEADNSSSSSRRCFFFVTVQVALKRLGGGPVGGRARPVHRHRRHPEGVLGPALQTWQRRKHGRRKKGVKTGS